MKKRIDIQSLMSVIVCIVPFIISAVLFNQLPEQIAIHFNAAGKPDLYASKGFASYGLPFIMLLLQLLYLVILVNDPKKQNSSRTLKYISKWIIPVTSLVIQTALITYSIGIKTNINFFALLLVGIIIILLGNYMPKCKQNYTLGIKLPWTLSDSDNWYKTHRMAGYLWIAGGFFLVIDAFIMVEWMAYTDVALLITIPILYSYYQYKRKLGNNQL